MLLLCSHLALPQGAEGGRLQPLRLRTWNDVAAALLRWGMRPGALLDMDVATMQARLHLPLELAGHICRLLARRAQLGDELIRLQRASIWTLTRAHDAYPALLKERMGRMAPPVLFGAGDRSLLAQGFLAVVGARQIDQDGAAFARAVGQACAAEGRVLLSGCARGVDRISMAGCLQSGGCAMGVLADRLQERVREPAYRRALAEGQLLLLSAVHPAARFLVASAMARNRLIYALARYGLVVAAALHQGGSWAGALSQLKARWTPLFVREGGAALAGNRELIRRGALPFPQRLPAGDLAAWLQRHASAWNAPVAQMRLF